MARLCITAKLSSQKLAISVCAGVRGATRQSTLGFDLVVVGGVVRAGQSRRRRGPEPGWAGHHKGLEVAQPGVCKRRRSRQRRRPEMILSRTPFADCIFAEIRWRQRVGVQPAQCRDFGSDCLPDRQSGVTGQPMVGQVGGVGRIQGRGLQGIEGHQDAVHRRDRSRYLGTFDGRDLSVIDLELVLVRLQCVTHRDLRQCQIDLADSPRPAGANSRCGDFIPIAHGVGKGWRRPTQGDTDAEPASFFRLVLVMIAPQLTRRLPGP